MASQKLIPHLFRTEFGKIVSVICKTFGLSNIQLAEDIVSETFLTATETWGLKGIPDNPTAWLYQVSKNKTKDYFKREKIFSEKVIPHLENQGSLSSELNLDLSSGNIKDSQLQMIFAICNPTISQESQIALALRILCGFGIEEISKALLSNKSTVNKRLNRAKEKIRQHVIDLSFPPENELESRLNNVLHILYLLFNEGYYSTTSEKTIRKDLCLESMRLLYMLIDNKSTNQPKPNALMALFCFHTSRFEARLNQLGEHILYDEQNKEKWNLELIQKGEQYLNQSASGSEITKYHLEAMIAFWHTHTTEPNKKWENILQLYNKLLQIEYSPITALNRTYALSMVSGKEKALEEALKINLHQNHLYHSLLAELYQGINYKKQIEHLQTALKLVDTENDKKVILRKLDHAKKKTNE